MYCKDRNFIYSVGKIVLGSDYNFNSYPNPGHTPYYYCDIAAQIW